MIKVRNAKIMAEMIYPIFQATCVPGSWDAKKP